MSKMPVLSLLLAVCIAAALQPQSFNQEKERINIFNPANKDSRKTKEKKQTEDAGQIRRMTQSMKNASAKVTPLDKKNVKTKSTKASISSTKAQTEADYKDYVEAFKKTGGDLEYLKKMPKQKLPAGKRQPKRGVPKDNCYSAYVIILAQAFPKTMRKRRSGTVKPPNRDTQKHNMFSAFAILTA